MDLAAQAVLNLQQHLRDNAYPGRGLVVGRTTQDDAWLQIYWIMGRSENSRNRRFVVDGATMRTEAVDPAKLTDPTNVIYEAMLELPDVAIVSNGDQTRTISDVISAGGTFEEALATREREDDAPNFTPRISAIVDRRGRDHGVAPQIALSILRANDADSALTDRTTFRPDIPPAGVGLGLTTYQGDGDPLPSFRGDPLHLPLEGDVSELIDRYWAALNPDNRVALAVKRIADAGGPSEITVRNRHDSA
jgi:IMP cyclohydrolase